MQIESVERESPHISRTHLFLRYRCPEVPSESGIIVTVLVGLSREGAVLGKRKERAQSWTLSWAAFSRGVGRIWFRMSLLFEKQKLITSKELSADGLKALGPMVATLVDCETLQAHANADRR